MTLLRAAVLLGEEVGAVPDIERTDALRALELVRGEAHEVGPEGLEIEVDPGRSLDGIDVEDDPTAAPQPVRDLGDRLDRPDLVVGEHDADEDRPVRDRRVDLVRVDPTVSVDRQLDDLEPELLEVAQAVADRVMLDRARHDPVPTGLAGPGRALQGEVVRLGPAGREDDLARLGVEPGASRSCASSSAARARRPKAWADDGLPNTSPRYGSIASTTSGRTGVVAA